MIAVLAHKLSAVCVSKGEIQYKYSNPLTNITVLGVGSRVSSVTLNGASISSG
jgi:hypothetical protein